MRLVYLMRHGEASLHAATDELRPLTQRGARSVSAAAAYFRGKGSGEPDIVASPLLRAQQTATIMQTKLHLARPLLTSIALVPGADPATSCRALGELAGDLLLVTHQPFISRLLEFLTGQQVGLDTANMVAVTLDVLGQETGEIAWIYYGED